MNNILINDVQFGKSQFQFNSTIFDRAEKWLLQGIANEWAMGINFYPFTLKRMNKR